MFQTIRLVMRDEETYKDYLRLPSLERVDRGFLNLVNLSGLPVSFRLIFQRRDEVLFPTCIASQDGNVRQLNLVPSVHLGALHQEAVYCRCYGLRTGTVHKRYAGVCSM